MKVETQNLPLSNAPWTIAIVGAGPVGLAMAWLLLKRGFPAEQLNIFEAEESANTRATLGGTLDLHPGSGLQLIEQSGLRAQFDALSRPEGEEIRLFNESLDCLFEHAPFKDGSNYKAAAGNPEIDRSDLRKMLLDAASQHVQVKWDHKLTSITEDASDESGRHVLHFSNGTTHTADLVIGSDGAWSKVRRFLGAHPPVFTGRVFFEFTLSPDNPAFGIPSAWTGEGFCKVIGTNGKVIIFQKNSARGGMLRAYAVAAMDEQELKEGGRFSPLVMADSHKAKQLLVDYFKEDGEKCWHPDVLHAILLSDADFASIEIPPFSVRPFYYVRPEQLTWETKPGVEIIGDAAHLMSPFAGEGVNQGFADCISLVRELERGVTSSVSTPPLNTLHKAQQAYEQEMVSRIKKHCIRAQTNLEMACPTEDERNRYQRQHPASVLADQYRRMADQMGGGGDGVSQH